MPNYFPLIANAAANVIQEIPVGSMLDLSQSGIANSGNITVSGLVSSTTLSTTGNITAGNVAITGSSLTWANASIVQTSAVDLSITGDGQVTVRSLDGTYQWTFDNAGNLTTPGNMTISGNVNALGTQTALLQPTDDLPLSFISSGANGTVTSFWTEDFGNLMSSNIAAIYTPLQGTQTVRIVTGTNGGNVAIYDFDKDGEFTTAAVSATGNVFAGNVSASGNVTGNYILGNGSQLTGIAASYGNANVATFLAAYGSNTISTTGTITSGNILSNGYARLSGTFDESQASTSGLYLGYAGGTPRIMFGTGNTSQTFEIDNDSGTLRFYQPGSTKASLTSTGDFSVAGNITGNVSGFAIGYLNIPQVSFTGNATLAASDAGKHFYSTLSTANTLTIANNTSVSWAVGTAILVVNRGTANINIAQDTGVSLYLTGNTTAGNRVVTTYGMATLLNVAANVWMISGSGVI